MKNFNSVLLSGILACLVILILQNAGVILQPEGAPVGPTEITGKVEVTAMPVDLSRVENDAEIGAYLATLATEAISGSGLKVSVINTPTVEIQQEAGDALEVEIQQNLLSPLEVNISELAGRKLRLRGGDVGENLEIDTGSQSRPIQWGRIGIAP